MGFDFHKGHAAKLRAKKLLFRVGIALWCLVVLAGLATGCSEQPAVSGPDSSSAAVVVSEPTASPTASPTAAPTPTPSPEPTAEPTPEPTPEPTAAPTAAPTEAPAAAEPQSNMVWIAGSGKGKKYHSSPACSNMKNPVEITLSDAQARGYGPCSKCY